MKKEGFGNMSNLKKYSNSSEKREKKTTEKVKHKEEKKNFLLFLGFQI